METDAAPVRRFLTACSCWCGLLVAARPSRHAQWQPLVVPVHLKIGSVRTHVFTPGLDTRYRLFIEIEHGTTIERLECLLGMIPWRQLKVCAGIPEAIDVDWKVLRGTEVSAAGSSPDFSAGSAAGDKMTREISYFTAQKNQSHSVVLTIHREGGVLNSSNPMLLVQTYPGEWKDALVGEALTSTLRSFVIGACTSPDYQHYFLAPLFGRLYRRRRQARNNGAI